MWTRSKGVFPPSPAAQLGWGQASLEGETSLKFEVHLYRSVSPPDGTEVRMREGGASVGRPVPVYALCLQRSSPQSVSLP